MDKATDVTRIFYYLNDQDIPYLTKLNIPPNQVTLGDFKKSLKINTKIGFKYFFKSYDEEVGIVKEEIINDSSKLPLVKGKVYVWLVPSADGSNLNDDSNDSQSKRLSSMNQNKYFNRNCNGTNCDTSDCETTETESVISNKRGDFYSLRYFKFFNF